LVSEASITTGFLVFLFALIILFAGLSILETSTNSYVYVIGPEETATARLNFAQSFNPFGAIAGVVISQVFVLSNLNTMTAAERAALSAEELTAIQGTELSAVTSTYVAVGLVMVGILILIALTKMPKLKEGGELDFAGTFRRLRGNRNYVWAVIAQFFYVGAQIAVWSFTIRYVLRQLNLDGVLAGLGDNPSTEQIIATLRGVEPLAAGFYNLVEAVGFTALLPQTAEQAGATYYIMALILFVIARFVCTALMKVIAPHRLLTILSLLAFGCCLLTIYSDGFLGIYALVAISGCMSLMFPTIFGMGISGLGDDTKLGGAGMVMAIAGAAVLTQIQGVVSDSAGSIKFAYWVPAIAFLVITFYSAVIFQRAAAREDSAPTV
ncbi:MAG: L-fucose:H+ symporter permease, partial [Bacteroidota bacterium]